MKVHKSSVSSGDRSLAAMFFNQMSPEEQKKADDRLRIRARDTKIAFIVSDIVSAAVEGRCRPTWLRKAGGRKCSRGAHRRKPRPFVFKKKVILDYERYAKLFPELEGHISTLVADIWDISRQHAQVNEYNRKRDHVFEKAKCASTGHSNLIKWKQGLFPDQEQVVHQQYSEEQKCGSAS